jgi:hypothetical protein
LRVALTWVTAVADVVATAGAVTSRVLTVSSEPLLVPVRLVAEILKWYVVFATNALTKADTPTGLSPDPGSEEHGALDP